MLGWRRLGRLAEQDLGCCGGECLHLGDDLFEVSPVRDPLPVEVGFGFVESSAFGLGGDRAARLVVGAMALGRVGLAAAVRFAV